MSEDFASLIEEITTKMGFWADGVLRAEAAITVVGLN